jgi:hypothetical protein
MRAVLPQGRFGRPSLATLYLRAMDSISKVQPGAIFVLEVRHDAGTLQYALQQAL